VARGRRRGQAERVKIECELETLRQGWPAGLDLSVTNESPDQVLVLDAAEWSEPLWGRHAWGKEALGSLRYESGEDEYVLSTTVGLRAPLALQGGVLLPGARARTMLASSCLEAGQVGGELGVRGWSFPLSEFAERVYQLDPSTAARPIQRFRRGAEPEGQVRDAWVHLDGAEPRGAKLEVEFKVEADPEAPAEEALGRVPGGNLVGRVRRLGGAWVVAEPSGALNLVRGAEVTRLPAGTVDLPLLRALDRDPPFVPLDLVFRGEAAVAWRDSGQVPLAGAELGQQRLEVEHLPSLMATSAREGFSLRWGRHATIAAGVIVSSER
jgi:hypothetical protein